MSPVGSNITGDGINKTVKQSQPGRRNIAAMRSATSPNAKAKIMGKEQKSNKETKKQPGMTPKEKKAAKKAKKNEKSRMGE